MIAWEDLAFQLSTAVGCLLVFFRAEGAINRMTRQTAMIVRLAFEQLAAAAAAGLVAIAFFRYVPNWHELLMAGGVASLMMCERRIRLLSRDSRRRAAS